jgi:hypothetical protein
VRSDQEKLFKFELHLLGVMSESVVEKYVEVRCSCMPRSNRIISYRASYPLPLLYSFASPHFTTRALFHNLTTFPSPLLSSPPLPSPLLSSFHLLSSFASPATDVAYKEDEILSPHTVSKPLLSELAHRR